MDALILSCGTGGGHDSAARAVMEELDKRGHRAVMLNPYTLRSGSLARRIDKSYIGMVQKTPKVFGAVYKIGNAYRKLPFRSPVYFVNSGMVDAMQKYLENNHFDVIIMTHLFPAEILTNMKRRGLEIPKTVFVATDYACIPFTEETNCDAYVIPAVDLTDEFAGRGVPQGKLYPFGIPVRSAFASEETREQAKQRLGLGPDKKYIVVAGGSMGGGKIEKAIGGLCAATTGRDEIGLIVICGSNKDLFEKLQAINSPGMTVVGRTDAMASYLKAAHLFVTKPGGLSSTEAAVCGVPIVHTSAIPGCESCNDRYFSEHGMSISVPDLEQDSARVFEVLDDAGISAAMIGRQRKYISSSAAARICGLAERLAEKS